MSVHAYHPGTGADLVVEEGQLAHMRASGWMLRSEYEENQAAAEAREHEAQAKAQPQARAAAKSNDEER